MLALGAELAYDLVPGLFPAAYSFYDLEQAVRLQEALARFEGGHIAVLIPSIPYKCPAAPYESALLIDYYLRKKGIRSESQVSLFTPEPQPLPVAGPAVGAQVRELLSGRDIGLHPEHKLKSIDPEERELSFENGQTAGYDLLVAIPPHRCPTPVREAGLINDRGWVPVDRGTLRMSGVENGYALGDVTFIPLASGMPLPKAGVFAHGQGKVVAGNIAGALLGREAERFKGEGA